MSVLSRTMSWLLLACWGLAMSHCELEQVPGLEFLSCCPHQGVAPHQDDDCTVDGCAVVESGLYKVEEQPVSAPEPMLLANLLTLLPASAPAIDPAGFDVDVLSASPPELAHLWQFSSRAALPPRAPSFVS